MTYSASFRLWAIPALVILNLASLVSSQQYAGEKINTTLPNVAGTVLTYFKIANPNGAANSTLTMTNYMSLNKAGGKVDGANVQRAIIVIHGLQRDPQNYISAVLSALSQVTDQSVNQDSVAVMAPYFPNGNDKNIGFPWTAGLSPGRGSTSSAMVWSASAWAEGGNNQYPYNQATVSSFSVLDQFVQYFNDPTIFPNMKQIVVAGHSLGAQTVNRYAAVGNSLNLKTPIVYYIANPNSYLWMSLSRPLDSSTCSTYDDWRDGLSNYASDNVYGTSLVAQGRSAVLSLYNSRTIAYARGTLDLGDDSTTCAPSTTGANRNERFFNFIKAFPPTCTIGGVCDTIDYVATGHDAGAMFASTSGQSRLFLDNFNGNGSKHYDIGYPRLQAGDDPYPDPSLNTTTTGAPVRTYAGNMTYVGCYSDQSPQSLSYMAYSDSSNTIEKCTDTCNAAGYTIAGAEFGIECYCGNTLTSKAVMTVDSGCILTCPGNSSEICGDNNRLSVYSNGTPQQLVAPNNPPTVSRYNFQGCYTESSSGRALSSAATSGSTVTLESCAAFCGSYAYFGVEYGDECYCGNTLGTGSVIAANTDCSMLCPGNQLELCGAGNRLSLYMSNTTAPIVASSSSSAAGSSATTPAVVGLDCPGSDGVLYTASDKKTFMIECGIDHAGGDLSVTTAMSLEGCILACDGATGCQAWSWVSGGANACYLKSSIGAGAYNSLVWGGKLVSSSAGSTTVGTSANPSTSSSGVAVASSSSEVLPPSTTAPVCPGSNGQSFVATSGHVFLVECGIDHGGDSTLSYVPTLAACINACDATTGCLAFSWVGNTNNVNSPCYMKNVIGANNAASNIWGGKWISNGGVAIPAAVSSSLSAPASVSTSTGMAVTSAVAKTTSAAAASTILSCPASNGQIFTPASGRTFMVECSIDHSGDSTLTYVSTLNACISACDALSGCLAFSWVGNSNNVNSPCYMKNILGAGSANSQVWGGKLVSVAAVVSPTAISSPITTSTTKAAVTTGLTCPEANGTVYSATSGLKYMVQCALIV